MHIYCKAQLTSKNSKQGVLSLRPELFKLFGIVWALIHSALSQITSRLCRGSQPSGPTNVGYTIRTEGPRCNQPLRYGRPHLLISSFETAACSAKSRFARTDSPSQLQGNIGASATLRVSSLSCVQLDCWDWRADMTSAQLGAQVRNMKAPTQGGEGALQTSRSSLDTFTGPWLFHCLEPRGLQLLDQATCMRPSGIIQHTLSSLSSTVSPTKVKRTQVRSRHAYIHMYVSMYIYLCIYIYTSIETGMHISV